MRQLILELIFIATLASVICYSCKQGQRCEAKGGVFLNGRCFKGDIFIK